jgi:hypothetical protein
VQTSPELLNDDGKYSQVSPAAVVALLLGLASPLAFIGPLFYLAPAAAVGLALLALSGIRRSDGALTGQTLARLAIALALGCLSAAMVRQSVRDSLMQGQAVDVAKRYLKLLADERISDALMLLTPESGGKYLQSSVKMGESPMSQEDITKLIADGLSSDVVSRAVKGQDDPGVLETVAAPIFNGARTIVFVEMGVQDSAAGGHRHVQFQLARTAAFEREGEPWRIESWEASEAHGAH